MRRASKVDAKSITDALNGATIEGAATKLGMSRATLCRRMAEHGISARPSRSGERFGRWTIISVTPGTKTRAAIAEAVCDCGTKAQRILGSITGGASQSCGCLRDEMTVQRSTKHGRSSVPEYAVWQGMRQRCSDPKADNYRWYGALGVRVCSRWDSFAAFLEDMGPRPSPMHSIDRINPFGDYEPSNCRWATKKQQAENKRAAHASS